MIEVFKTHCKLPDGSIGEVCKQLVEGWLVCNSNGWWQCDSDWILENKIEVKTTKMKFIVKGTL
jgi:hypothetical protein